MHTFISCDWGTSTFRLRLIDASSAQVLGQVMSNQGIAEIYEQFKQKSLDKGNRFSFYQSFISDQLTRLQEQLNTSLRDLPLIISGMASSNIGMVELPYKDIPFATDGSDLELKKINATEEFSHDIVLISGVKFDQDVMRGEETQLIGCSLGNDEERVYIFPGTHSKHVTVKNQNVTDFKTYMTGEFFHLLSNHGILSQSVQQGDKLLAEEHLKSFEDGVTQSVQDNLLHNVFLVRTNHLLKNLSRQENYYYLSGLLIGEELKKIAHSKIPVTLVGSEVIQKYYAAALQKLGVNNVETDDADMALVRGHCKVYHRLYIRGNQPNV